ncbi:hypothetical protein [Dokdonia sp. Dokd-P16]|uniref:hypothetical protein n=1 Tax=Dokdonia sp. Dokd-P16 TaxID=2173169 RepID=UPI0013A55186|nr:hypothetical protein [Dokdonia sp. Dokd-P16]
MINSYCCEHLPKPLFEEGLHYLLLLFLASDEEGTTERNAQRLGGDVLRVSEKFAADISPNPSSKRGFHFLLLLFEEEAGRRCFLRVSAKSTKTRRRGFTSE